MPPAQDLLTPREAAALLGVRTATLARWAREGRLRPLHTPGGHRRYSREEAERIIAANPGHTDAQEWVTDAVRLYDRGWNIRQVAEKFGCGYGTMRRLLRRRTTLRTPGAPP